MRMIDVDQLQPGDRVEHSRYGLCEVTETLRDSGGGWFGTALRPLFDAGQAALYRDCVNTPILEGSIRRMKKT